MTSSDAVTTWQLCDGLLLLVDSTRKSILLQLCVCNGQGAGAGAFCDTC